MKSKLKVLESQNRFWTPGTKPKRKGGDFLEFSFLVPYQHIKLSSLSKYHLVLPTWYIQHDTYRRFYLEMKERGDFLILDNGYHERNGESADWQELNLIIDELEPHVVVAPEPDTEITPDDLIEENIEECLDIKHDYPEMEFMFVQRGIRVVSLLAELDSLIRLDKEEVFSWISYHKDQETLQEGNLGGRRMIVDKFEKEGLLKNKKIHMLGIYKDPIKEMQTFLDHPMIMGCDSAKPWRITSLGRAITRTSPYPARFDIEGKTELVIEEHVKDEFVRFMEKVNA